MKASRFGLALALGLFATTAVQAEMLKFSFSSVTDAKIRIQGDGTNATISFVPGIASQDFGITNVDPSTPGDANDQTGTFSGTFSFNKDDVTTYTTGFERAVPLTSNSASLSIGDTVSGFLTADILDSGITRSDSSSTINSLLYVNLSNIKYTAGTGSPIQDFQTFAKADEGTIQLAFSLGTTSLSLSDMTASGFDMTFGSYSGNLSVVPEPSSLFLMALASGPLLGLTYRWRRKPTP